MLTDSALFFLNLCNEYRDIREAKARSGVSEAWLKQNKATAVQSRRRPITEDDDDDDDDDDTVPEATSSAANKPSKKKRITNSGVAVVSRVQALPSNKSRKASTSTPGDSEKVRDNGPKDVQTSVRYGGLEDEDDDEEWEAIRQSPVKEPGVRISDHVRCRYVHFSTPC